MQHSKVFSSQSAGTAAKTDLPLVLTGEPPVAVMMIHENPDATVVFAHASQSLKRVVALFQNV
jgi:hypothetical protein